MGGTLIASKKIWSYWKFSEMKDIIYYRILDTELYIFELFILGVKDAATQLNWDLLSVPLDVFVVTEKD